MMPTTITRRLGENVIFMSSVAAALWLFAGPIADPLFSSAVHKVLDPAIEENQQQLEQQLIDLKNEQSKQRSAIDDIRSNVSGLNSTATHVDAQLDRIERQINTLTRSLLPRAQSPGGEIR
jgi:peptidoglycan hydrolase CwlO-like protein